MAVYRRKHFLLIFPKFIMLAKLYLALHITCVLANVRPLAKPVLQNLQFSDNDYELDNDELHQYDVANNSSKLLKQGGTITDPGTNTVIGIGVGCGFHRMIPNSLVQITSSNFGMAPYSNNDACVWRFTGDNCLLAAKCPCFDVPASFQCLGDHMKISDSILYNQKFCGDVAPQGGYRSVSGHLKIRFQSDSVGYAGKGFLCYVFCTEPGKADPALSLVNNPGNCFRTTTTTIGPTMSTPAGSTTPSTTTTTTTGTTGEQPIDPPSSVRYYNIPKPTTFRPCATRKTPIGEHVFGESTCN